MRCKGACEPRFKNRVSHFALLWHRSYRSWRLIAIKSLEYFRTCLIMQPSSRPTVAQLPLVELHLPLEIRLPMCLCGCLPLLLAAGCYYGCVMRGLVSLLSITSVSLRSLARCAAVRCEERGWD